MSFWAERLLFCYGVTNTYSVLIAWANKKPSKHDSAPRAYEKSPER